MGPQKFVVRLLDQAGTLLAWSATYAVPSPQERGASCPFWPVGERSSVFVIERDGLAAEITVHWCDLDVARRRVIDEPTLVSVGQALKFWWLEPVWLVPGTRDVPLPAVTVSAPVQIGVPVGSLNSVPA